MKKFIGAGSLPFSKAVVFDSNNMMEVSGQIGLNQKTGKLVQGIAAQTRQAIENIKVILEDQGWELNDVVKCRIYLTDMDDYNIINKIYSEYFKKYPARVTLAVKELPLGVLVEIECLAAK